MNGNRSTRRNRKVGYSRVSTILQSLNRQNDALWEAGVEYIYEEKVSGTKGKDKRPELKRMIDELQEGDTVVIAELTRVSRSLLDMLSIVSEITTKGCHLISLSESWIDTTSPHGKLMLQIFGALAEFERALLMQRTADGRESAKIRGVKFGRKKKKTDKLAYALQLYVNNEMSIREICRKLDVSKATLCRRIAEYKKVA